MTTKPSSATGYRVPDCLLSPRAPCDPANPPAWPRIPPREPMPCPMEYVLPVQSVGDDECCCCACPIEDNYPLQVCGRCSKSVCTHCFMACAVCTTKICGFCRAKSIKLDNEPGADDGFDNKSLRGGVCDSCVERYCEVKEDRTALDEWMARWGHIQPSYLVPPPVHKFLAFTAMVVVGDRANVTPAMLGIADDVEATVEGGGNVYHRPVHDWPGNQHSAPRPPRTNRPALPATAPPRDAARTSTHGTTAVCSVPFAYPKVKAVEKAVIALIDTTNTSRASSFASDSSSSTADLHQQAESSTTHSMTQVITNRRSRAGTGGAVAAATRMWEARISGTLVPEDRSSSPPLGPITVAPTAARAVTSDTVTSTSRAQTARDDVPLSASRAEGRDAGTERQEEVRSERSNPALAAAPSIPADGGADGGDVEAGRTRDSTGGGGNRTVDVIGQTPDDKRPEQQATGRKGGWRRGLAYGGVALAVGVAVWAIARRPSRR